MRNNKAQQEIVGFVLIVVLVMIGMMVFLVISSRSTPNDNGSLEVGNILDALMKYTTDCAIVYEPDYDDLGDLFKSCYKSDKCKNLGVSACDYLNESLRMIVPDMMASEATVSAYQLDFLVKDSEGEQGILRIFNGNCTGSMLAAQRTLKYRSDDLIIRMNVCGI